MTFKIAVLLVTSAWAQTPAVLPPAPAVVRQGIVISQGVAQVSDYVITSREVIVSGVIEKATEQKLPATGKKMDRSQWILKEGSENFQKHLAQVILEQVIQLEAENFSVGTVARNDIEAFQKHLAEAVDNWDPWKKLEVTQAEIEKMISRKLRAKNFLQFKMETSGVQISDEEAKKYFEKNRVKFGNLPFTQFKDGIKEVLAQEQMQEKLKEWFDILKRKYRVKYLGQSSN